MNNLAILTDEQGNFIGEKDRYSLKAGDIIAIASLWVENNKGEVLIAQRSFEKKHDPGLWGPAAAGTLEPGETFESNIIKEAEEEIGATNISVEEVHRICYFRPDNQTGRYSVWFRTKVDQPIEYFALQKEEVAAARWISKTDLLKEIEAHPEQFVGWPERWKKMIALSGYN